MKQEVRSSGAPVPIGPYSQAVRDGTSVFCSGQVGADPATGALAEGISAQTERAISNLGEVLKASGLSLANVVKTTVFMVDLSEFAQMNDVYSKRFASPFPARSTVQVSALPKGARVEIEAVATS